MEEQDDTPEISVSELLEIAKRKSRKVKPDERRRVIRLLEESWSTAGYPQEPSNYELADLFDVDESIIRRDKRKIEKEYTSVITPDDAMSFVGWYCKGIDALIRDARAGMLASPLGSLGHQNYIKILADLRKRKIEMLQEIGAIPKELGTLNTTEETWEAYVLPDGTTGNQKMPTLQQQQEDEAEDDTDE
jgi:hypothetical protein